MYCDSNGVKCTYEAVIFLSLNERIGSTHSPLLQSQNSRWQGGTLFLPSVPESSTGQVNQSFSQRIACQALGVLSNPDSDGN